MDFLAFDDNYKYYLGILATIITFAAFVPYIFEILKGKVLPHYFSFIIFALTTIVIFLGQLADGGGAGAWPIGVSGLITCVIAFLAYIKRRDNMVKKSDWYFFIAALSALPLWFITSDPMWTVLLLVGIDIVGLVPAARKAYDHPHEEQITFFAILTVRNIISIFALENYSITTLAFPVGTSVMCTIIALIVLLRRRVIPAA